MKVIKIAFLMPCIYIAMHLFFFTVFIFKPLLIEPETIRSRDDLFLMLGRPKYRFDVKGFVVWEKKSNFTYSTIEYRDDGVIVSSNILKKDNLQIFKNSKVWDGENLYQYITVWPYGRLQVLVKE